MEETKNFGVPLAKPNKYGIDVIVFREDDDSGNFSDWYMTTAPAYSVDIGDFVICESFGTENERHSGRVFLAKNFDADKEEDIYRLIEISGGMAYKLNRVMSVKWEATA